MAPPGCGKKGCATSLVPVYPHASARDECYALAKDLLGGAARRAQRRALEDAADDPAHLLQREARPEAAPRAAAERQPRVRVGRVVAEEALRPEVPRTGIAVAAAVDHRDRRVDLHAVREHVAAELERLAAHDAADPPHPRGGAYRLLQHRRPNHPV